MKKTTLITLIIVSTILLTIPVVIIIRNFNTQEISTDISKWGAFGDYIGGILNTTISLLSLIILGYLTHIVSKQSNEKNKKLNLLMRKLDAYEQVSEYLYSMQIKIPKISHQFKIVKSNLSTKEALENPKFKREVY